ncbi:Aldo/keto reductase [Auriscalpium vulgare]|uniref:Aldo/keto reductase n=1 Tax=Auriscalpium vulgare TaxID=40419 RepID=A0ACB8RIT2_9AGAM|nr:Aldo/keto reductase [Auriscalpium vulgare]
MATPSLLLNDGYKIPVLAFGTGSALYGRSATEYVDRALNAGFSHIDTAALYRNEDSVGDAIHESGLDRSDLYVTTKYGGGDIRESINSSLSQLGLKFVDLYLIHQPGLVKDIGSAWDEFVKLKDDGLAKSIGVSNFNVEQLQATIKTGKTKPAVNQIRFHPYNYASYKDLLEYSAKHGIVVEAYGSLAPITKTPGGPLDPVLAAIAKRIGGTPAQVIFKWVIAKGAVVVTTTSRPERLKEYLAVPELPDLTDAEVASIDAAGATLPLAIPRIASRAAVGTVVLLLLTVLLFRFVL